MTPGALSDVFVSNRRKLVRALNEAFVDGEYVVYLEGGESTTRFDSDHEPLFQQESYFWWLTGVKEPDVAVSVSSRNGFTTLFVPKFPPEYATIMGKIKTLEEWKQLYHVDRVLYVDDKKEALEKELSSSSADATTPLLLLLRGLNSDSGKYYEPPSWLVEQADTQQLFPILAECRVIKSPAELVLLRHVTEITSFAHAYVMRNMKPGMFELQAESLFRHYCCYNYGCRLVGYTPICGCGPSAAVLHYGHAGEPNAQQSKPTDMCLFDMGAEYNGYGSDVTCSFPVKGVFTEQQKPIYQAVLDAQIAVYAMIKPGVSYVDCHKAAEASLLQSLIQIGLVEACGKTVEELVDMRLGAVFMPHGLGHFIGVDTHDVGGYLEGHPTRIQEPGLKSLRTARILQANMVLTVEPGCYFIDHLIDTALSCEMKVHLNAAKINEYRGFGGVRLEDVIQVTANGMVNFTLCPRTVPEVEMVVQGGKWPPIVDSAPELRRERLTKPTPLPAPPSL